MFCPLVSILSSKETVEAETEVDVAVSEMSSVVTVSARSSIVVSAVTGSTSSNASLASGSKS